MNDANLQIDLSLKAEVNLYYDLAIPAGASEPAPLLIAVHGYGAHKRYMMHESRLVAPPNFAIASVQGPHQHFRQTDLGYKVGFGWLTDHRADESVTLHHKFLNDLIDKLVSDGTADADRIHLFGFSQACALNFRYAFTYPDVPVSVVGICGGIPGDLDSNPVYKPFEAETFYLYGNDDEFYTPEKFQRHDAKLKEILPNYTSQKYNAKHIITDEMRNDVRRFLTNLES